MFCHKHTIYIHLSNFDSVACVLHQRHLTTSSLSLLLNKISMSFTVYISLFFKHTGPYSKFKDVHMRSEELIQKHLRRYSNLSHYRLQIWLENIGSSGSFFIFLFLIVSCFHLYHLYYMWQQREKMLHPSPVHIFYPMTFFFQAQKCSKVVV